MIFFDIYGTFKNRNLKDRYLPIEWIIPELEKFNSDFKIKEEGLSVNGRKIFSVEIGNGPVKILGWSQMHGNETTTTKAVFDIFNFLSQKNEVASNILSICTIKIIPILNPDGAFLYTRENANKVDLNRDAKKLNETESRVLRKVSETFSPNFCLNLHDQRTIYSAGQVPVPATLSFLAPAMDEKRSVSDSRKIAMQLICAMLDDLTPVLKNKIGRYNDSYNENCTGDTFMKMGIPTVLFEAGHFPNDYMREESRKFTAFAIFSILKNIASDQYKSKKESDYFKIPENAVLFYDVIIRNANMDGQILDIGIQFNEEIKGEKIVFHPIIEEIAEKIKRYGHREIDAEHRGIRMITGKSFKIGELASEIFLNNKLLSLIEE